MYGDSNGAMSMGWWDQTLDGLQGQIKVTKICRFKLCRFKWCCVIWVSTTLKDQILKSFHFQHLSKCDLPWSRGWATGPVALSFLLPTENAAVPFCIESSLIHWIQILASYKASSKMWKLSNCACQTKNVVCGKLSNWHFSDSAQ